MRLAVLLIVTVCLFAASVAAQELTSTVRAARPSADGQSSTSVDPQAYAGEWRHAGDLAATAPGAIALDFGGLVATATLSLRGGGSDQLAVLFDGTPLDSPAGGGFDLSRIPAALLSGLEVRRGADARLGAQAMSGALVLEPVSGSRAVVSAGSLGTVGGSASHLLETTTRDATWRVLGAVDVRRSAGDFTYARDPTPEIEGNDPLLWLDRVNNDALLATALTRVERRTENTSSSAFLLLSHVERGLPGPIYSPTVDTRQREWSAVGRATWRRKALNVPLSVRAGTLRTTATAREIDTGQQSFLDVFATPSLTIPLGAARLSGDLLVGREGFVGTAHGERARVRGGLGLELSAEHGRWTGSLAVRAERWGEAWGVVPRAGGSVRIRPGLTLHANAGGGFRPPSFGELYFASGPVLPNPDLVAERAWSADVGARLTRRVGPLAVETGANLFGGLYQDTIVYELFSGTRAKPFNLAGSRVGGVEAHASVSPSRGVWRNLQATATGARLVTQGLEAGDNAWHKALPYRPAWRGGVRLSWKSERVRGAVGLTGTSSAWANRANTRKVDGFVDLGGSAGVRLVGDLWLGAEVRNALDVRERAVIEGYPLPGRLALAHMSWEPK